MRKFKEYLVTDFARKITSLITVAALLIMIAPQVSMAASLSAQSDTMSREKASTLSLHKIKFTSTSAIAAGNTIVLAFPAGFTTTGLVITDLQICHGVTTGIEHGTAVVTGATACTATDETIAGSNGASTVWGATVTGTTSVTFTAPSGSFTNAISAGHKVTIFIAATHMQNPTAGAYSITLTTTSDTGAIALSIVDDDQVAITATVNSSITFDIDVATTNTETASGTYTVALGTLTTANAINSDESTIKSIWLDLDTNAGGGAAISVLSANGALKSTSVPGDTIPSATATMAPNTANYGLCDKLNTASSGTFNKVSPFNGATCTTGHTNTVGAVTTSAQNIYDSNSLPIAGARAEIMVNASISGVTPAHSDYADTLTFIATGTF